MIGPVVGGLLYHVIHFFFTFVGMLSLSSLLSLSLTFSRSVFSALNAILFLLVALFFPSSITNARQGHTHTYTHMHTYTHAHTCTHTHTYTERQKGHTHTDAHSTHTHIYTCTHAHIYTYTHAHIYTHACTHEIHKFSHSLIDKTPKLKEGDSLMHAQASLPLPLSFSLDRRTDSFLSLSPSPSPLF